MRKSARRSSGEVTKAGQLAGRVAMAIAALVACSFVRLESARAAGIESATSAPRATVSTPACTVPIRCDAPLAYTAPNARWNHFRTRFTRDGQPARHRGHDEFVRAGAAQWVHAKFAYGVPGSSLEGEDVDVFVLRDCARWEQLGTTRTSGHGTTVSRADGSVESEPGIAMFHIPDAARLGVGMHRVRFVVRGDHTSADAMLNVLAPGARVVISDVDGTLTESEASNVWWEVGLRRVPAANPGAAATLRSFAERGFQIFYLTGRPDWTVGDTRTWLRDRGFPLGVLHTRSGIGIGGPNVTAYKIDEVRALRTILDQPADYGFGNTATDVAAYRAAGIAPDHRFFFRFAGDLGGGQRHDDYRATLVSLAGVPAVCRPNHALSPAVSAR